MPNLVSPVRRSSRGRVWGVAGCLLTLAAHAAIADELPRERVSLDDGWHFQKGEPQGLEDQ
ncbi:MAG: hypothetical protein ACTHM6_16600, partial [Tepidisphaeraceae bacterium]